MSRQIDVGRQTSDSLSVAPISQAFLLPARCQPLSTQELPDAVADVFEERFPDLEASKIAASISKPSHPPRLTKPLSWNQRASHPAGCPGCPTSSSFSKGCRTRRAGLKQRGPLFPRRHPVIPKAARDQRQSRIAYSRRQACLQCHFRLPLVAPVLSPVSCRLLLSPPTSSSSHTSSTRPAQSRPQPPVRSQALSCPSLAHCSLDSPLPDNLLDRPASASWTISSRGSPHHTGYHVGSLPGFLFHTFPPTLCNPPPSPLPRLPWCA
jgi:hypothetical protein